MSFTCGTRVAISFIIHNDQLVMTQSGAPQTPELSHSNSFTAKSSVAQQQISD